MACSISQYEPHQEYPGCVIYTGMRYWEEFQVCGRAYCSCDENVGQYVIRNYISQPNRNFGALLRLSDNE